MRLSIAMLMVVGYLALGNPIVTMFYPEIAPYQDMVYVARTHDEFIRCIEEALQEDDKEKKSGEDSALKMRHGTIKSALSKTILRKVEYCRV